MTVDNERLRVVAETCAERAGKRLATIFRRGRLRVRPKYDYEGSMVTNADIAAEKLILDTIRKSEIKSTVVSEEKGRVNYGGRKILWAVDPLDGTFNYAKRIPHFGVSVGVLEDGRTVAGAVYDPMLDEMFTARRGGGAYMNGRRISVSKTSNLHNASIIFEWWNSEPSVPDPLRLEANIYRYTSRVRSPGSIALNLCSVACGRFDGMITIFLRSPVHEPTGGAIIAEEAGGRATNSVGDSWETLSRSIVVGGPSIHRKLMRLVSRVR